MFLEEISQWPKGFEFFVLYRLREGFVGEQCWLGDAGKSLASHTPLLDESTRKPKQATAEEVM